MSSPSAMQESEVTEQAPMPIKFTRLFLATWSYQEFIRLAPFGEGKEGQAFAFTKPEGCAVEGDVLSGTLRLVQFPRWRSDGVYLPDAHGLIETSEGEQVMIRVAGLVIS